MHVSLQVYLRKDGTVVEWCILPATIATANYTYALIAQHHDVNQFQSVMLERSSKSDWGVHVGGPNTIGSSSGGVKAKTYHSAAGVTRVRLSVCTGRPGLLPSREN